MTSISQKVSSAIKKSPFGQKVKKAYLFGSYASGTQREESDIDILVELQSPIGYDFMRLEDMLSNSLQKKVDLQTHQSISPYIHPYIEKNMILIYEK